MLHSIKGIVIHSIKYAETSIIVKVYTNDFGIQSYLVKGIRNSKSKIKPGLFQPLTLLDLVVYHKPKQSLQTVKEIHLACPFKSIPFDIRKSSVALFINELVYKAIREEEANPDLFGFLWQTCLHLDETEESVSTYHLVFAIQLMQYLGIFPHNNFSPDFPVFNLHEGLFQASVPGHPHYLDPEKSRQMSVMLSACETIDMGNGEMTKWRNGEMAKWRNSEMAKWRNGEMAKWRNQLLEIILVYYQLHLPGFRALQSHHILHDVLA